VTVITAQDNTSNDFVNWTITVPKLFRKSKQDMFRIREALGIANNDSEIKRQFAMLNFAKIPHMPHMQPHNHNRFHVTFMPMIPINELERRHNVSVIDANISLEDRKVHGFEIRMLFPRQYRGCDNENCTFPGFAGRPEYCDDENCTFAWKQEKRGFKDPLEYMGYTPSNQN